MKSGRAMGAALAFCLCSSWAVAQPAPQTPPSTAASTGAAPEATLFRVFLKDGTSLVSYGEVARVGDSLVFSMPATVGPDPDLRLVNLPLDQVDWDHTSKYAESVRANRYLATRAELDYTNVSNEVAQALNSVASVPDPVARLAIVQKARKTLAEWPASHYNYRAAEIKQMLGMLDEAIADLRVAAGANRFDLTLATTGPNVPTPSEPLLPGPTPQEAIEGVMNAARLTSSPAERSLLLNAALAGIQKDADALPSGWASATRASITAVIAHEQDTDRAYRSLTTTMLGLARTRAKAADVRGLQRLLEQIHARDATMGAQRPDSVKALIDSVQVELDAARRLQLARDQWALRAPDYRKYHAAILVALNGFTQLKTPLENIKALAGSSPFALADIERASVTIRTSLADAKPPAELVQAHSLLSSAVELASSAARIRREAALTTSMTRAWDASAAAAGALMLVARARDELNAAIQMPQLAALPPPSK